MAYSFANDVYKPLAKAIVERFNMTNVDLDKICFISNSSGKPKDYAARIKMFKPPYDLFIDYVFYIEIFETKVRELTSNQITAAMYRTLLFIADDGESLRKPDVSEFSKVIELVGPNWLNDSSIVDILQGFQSESR